MDVLQKPPVWNGQVKGEHPRTRRIQGAPMTWLGAGLGVGLILLTGVAVLGGRLWRQADCAARVNSVCLNRAELAWYRDNHAQLGEVVGRGPVDGRSAMFFTYYAAVPNPRPEARGTREAWELLDLGRRDALRRGLPLRPGAAPHPVVQAYLDAQERQGMPWRYWLGFFPISDVYCIAGAGASAEAVECVQAFPNQVLRFRPTGSSVELTPLGARAPRPGEK